MSEQPADTTAEETVTQFIGGRLREVREARGLSHRTAGVLLGMSSAAIGSYERGQRNVTAVRLVAIAATYGVPVASLLPAEPSSTPDGTDLESLLQRALLIARADSKAVAR